MLCQDDAKGNNLFERDALPKRQRSEPKKRRMEVQSKQEAKAMTSLSSHWWWDLSTRDFAATDMSAVVAILPVGAVEQHGPHLPVRVDAAINAGIIARAVALMPPDLPALVLPALPIGKSNEHIAFPGTLSLPYDLLARLWFEVAKSAWRAGVRKIILFNSHGGQPQVMEIVCRELRVELGMFAVGASWFRTIDSSDLYSAGELRHGIHGGEAETSVMLHLHPDLVRMEHAADFVPRSVAMERDYALLTPEGGVGFGWQAQDLHPAGACGNAAAADAARGAEQVERAAQALLGLIREVQTYPLAAVTGQTAYN
jgi:creatinine amidohydrolase